MPEPESTEPSPPTEPIESVRPSLRWQRVALQLAGFVIGVALIVWCVHRAAEGDGWSQVRSANPWLLAALFGCTLVSLVLNGAVFWISARPLHPMPFVRLQAINVVAALLNYAPVRLGLIARIAFHVRVDRISAVDLACWFGAMTLVLGTVLAATTVATLIRPQPDLVWLGLLFLQVAVVSLALRVALGSALATQVRRRLPRLLPLLTDPTAFWGSVTLRTLDLAALTARMAIAATLLGDSVDLSIGDLTLLAVTALFFGMSPLGRLGFREAGVAFVAARLSGGLDTVTVDAAYTALGLLESVGEAVVAVPLGIIALPWFWKRLTAPRAS